MIKLTNLNKYYNKKKNNEIHVINDVNLSLPDTGLITFLGQSGSGKTTLLNVVGGLDKASGVIEYDDVEVKKYRISKVDKIRREKISYIFQNYNLLLSETVYDNLRIALYAINITDENEVNKRAEYALKMVGMYKYRKKLASALSGGQMQRVAIARCLIKSSSVIIADEPTGNLDSKNSLEIMNILKKISKTSLVLLVTHDKGLAEYFSDSIVEISDGKVVNERDTSTDGAYVNANDNNIYLHDLNKIEDNTDNSNVTYYFEKENKKLQFTIVEHNNCFYLQSNVKIKLLEETNFKLVDASVKDEQEIVKEDFEFDTTHFSNNVRNTSFRLFLAQVKDSFFNFFKRRKRTKFFHMAMFLIGIIVAFVNISYASYNYIDTNNISYDKSVYKLKEIYNYENVENVLKVAKTNGYIDELYNSNDYVVFKYTKNFYQTKSTSLSIYFFNTNLIQSDTIIAGRMAENTNEIVLSKKVADKILKDIDKNAGYEILINNYLSKSYVYESTNKVQIVGIVDRDAYAAYSITQDDNYPSYYSAFTTHNYDALQQYLKNNDLKVDTLYNATYYDLKTSNQDQKLILLPVIIILISITLIYIYFAMRSKMINDIYNIGVYRAIAYSRSKITLKYVIDIFFMTMFTSVLGYLIITVGYSYIAAKINNLAEGLIKQTPVINQLSTYVILLGLIGVSIIIGIIPILSLLRKTPSQILAKYDI